MEPEEPTTPDWLQLEPSGAPPVGPEPDASPVAPPSSGWLKPALVGGLVGALVAAAVAGGIVAATDNDTGGSSISATRSATSRPASTLAGAQLDIRDVLKKVEPAVVAIETTTSRGEGAGSGMVISKDGLVLTNAHVVAGARTVTVVLPDGTRLDGKVVESVEAGDIALVKVEGKDLDVVELGDSSAMQVGDEVVAVGNALGLGADPTVTRGILSALDRTITVQDPTNPGREVTFSSLLQTDAAINPGNSGGPLLNAQGQVVGVNSAVAGNAENIGFALAIDSVKPLIERIRSGKEAGFLGVVTRPVDLVNDATRQRYGIKRDDGAFVAEVSDGSGAAEAGLQPGDVIIAIEGSAVRSPSDVARLVQSRSPGDTVEITYVRAGDEKKAKAKLGAIPVSQN
jgi:putative serine protease PepD